MQSNFSSKARISSTGIAAPPDMQMRSVEVSVEPARSACSSALYIVGTPWKTVTASRSMISSALSGSKRGSIVTVAPLQTAQFIVQVWPNEWNSGSAPSSTSPGLNSAKPDHRVAVAQQVRVRQLGALGLAGGAARVEDHRGVVRGAIGDARGSGSCCDHELLELARLDEDALSAGLRGALLRRLGEAVPGEHELGAGVLEVVAPPRAPSAARSSARRRRRRAGCRSRSRGSRARSAASRPTRSPGMTPFAFSSAAMRALASSSAA